MKGLKSLFPSVLIIVAGVVACCTTSVYSDITPGTDHWTTVAPTEIIIGSNSIPAIPADFFFPGSEPFTGTVCLRSKPIDPCSSNADTYIERMSSGVPDCNIPIKLTELSLVSTAPIVVDFPAESFFDVFVTIKPSPPSTGQLEVTRKDPNGGTFDMALNVRYRFEFTPVDSNRDPNVWEPGNPVTVKSSFFYEWKDGPLEGSVPAGNNFYPVKGEPHIMDLACGGGRHSIEPAVDGNDYEWKPADLLPYGIRAKWAQPPVVKNIWDPNLIYYGWNVYSEFAADDFWSDTNDPITMIRWWGSFENWHLETVPEPNDLPPKFRLTIWTDVPPDYADPESYSHPGGIIHTIDCNNYEVEFFGWEEDPWTGQKTTKFQFTQYLEPNDYWQQPGDWGIYWLGIEALYGYNECADCNADFDGDGDVDMDDLDIFVPCLGQPPQGACEQADLNCDGVIDGNDTNILVCQMNAGWPDPNCCTGSPVIPEHRFGWETRTHYFMDDAVSGCINPDTNELSCSPIKDQEGFSWDLSFKLGTGEIKEPVRHLKWSQPPIETVPQHESPRFYGYDMWAFTPLEDPENPGPSYWVCLADDFRCIGSMPVTSIHWWGSYYNWTKDYYLYYKMPPVQPSSWWIGFWSNTFEDPCDMLPWGRWSRPHKLLWEIELDANRVEQIWMGDDERFEHPDPGDDWLDFAEDVCFQYYVHLGPNEFFWQDDFNSPNDIYWISIIADYNDPVQAFPWGWKTRPKLWMDSSVLFWMTGDPWVGMVLGPEYWLTNQPPIVFRYGGPLFYIDRLWDLSFELDTDPNWVKWEQPFTGLRDWAHYEDVNSWAIDEGEPNIVNMVADDWLCQRRTPVTSIVWWGSYLDYAYNPSEPNFLGMPPPNKPDYFLIYFWTDMPVDDPCNMLGYSYPRRKVWEYRAYEYDEVFIGYDKHVKYGYPLAARQEAVFRYSVRVPEEEWFRQPKVDGIYWISIVAVYDQLNPPTYSWGWTNHKHVFNDDAVSGRPLPDDGGWEWFEIFDQTGESADMSFVLFTDPNQCNPCPDYDIDGTVDGFDLDVFTDNWLWTGLPGGFNDGDLNCDGEVTFYDYAIFALIWLDSCP